MHHAKESLTKIGDVVGKVEILVGAPNLDHVGMVEQ